MAFNWWAKAWDSQIIRRIRGVQAQTDRGTPNQAFTTELGTAGTPSPRIPEESRMFEQRYGRRAIIYDVRKMLAENPMLAEAASVFVDTAISKSFTVNVEQTSKRGVLAGTQMRAQRIINRLIKDANIAGELPSWAKRGLKEGDVFVQAVELDGQIVDAMAMPSVSMERMSDERDRFPDPLNAFRQVDVTTNEDIARFAQWQIIHARWDHESGERYGNSQYLQLRTMNKIFMKMVKDMAIRRAVRATLRRFHRVGNDANPGTWDDVEKYIALNKLDETAGIAEDYYGTFNVDVKTLEGDARLDQIKDIEFVLNVLFPRTGLAKGLIGFGETVSRDILDDQREFMNAKQDMLVDWIGNTLLRPLFNLALLVEGINPDAINYVIQFEERLTERDKVAKLEMMLEMRELGVMTDRQLIERAAPYINVRDVDKYLAELDEERKRKRIERQEDLAAGVTDPTDQDPEALAKKGIDRDTLGKRNNVRRAAFGKR